MCFLFYVLKKKNLINITVSRSTLKNVYLGDIIENRMGQINGHEFFLDVCFLFVNVDDSS